MKKLFFLFFVAFIFVSCEGANSSSSNSDFEGIWRGNSISLQFSSANLHWCEAGKDELYTFSASNGSIIITEHSGATKSGSYKFLTSPKRLKLKLNGKDEITLLKMSSN